MSEQLQLRRGTAAQIAANTPAAGEVWVDTDHTRLVVGDGSTVGGFAVPKMVGGRELCGGRQGGQRQPRRRHAARCSAAARRHPLPRDPRHRARDFGLADRGAGRGLQRGERRRRRDLLAAGALRPDLERAGDGGQRDRPDARARRAATFFTATTLYFRITTPQGAAATFDVILHIQPYD